MVRFRKEWLERLRVQPGSEIGDDDGEVPAL